MDTYVSMLRGVNVGKNQMKMEELRKLYEVLGFKNVKSYVQSGNVIFEADGSSTGLLETILSDAIEQEFGFRVPVVVLTIDELKKIIGDNPLTEREDLNPSFMHVTFLSSVLSDRSHASIEAKRVGEEEVFFGDRAVYIYCPHGYGTTKLNNNFLEKKLKVCATTRNLKTANELLRLGQENRIA